MVKFSILGQLEVWCDERRVELGGHKQRAVLAALLVEANRVVSLDRLIDDLWPQRPPARAGATVQVFVSNLRRVLEPERPRGTPAVVLMTRAPGSLLKVEPDALDTQLFERLAGEGGTALVEGDPQRAVELLAEAWGLWRGHGDLPLPGGAGTRSLQAVSSACSTAVSPEQR
jgi:DNA-binding SARP family transcriptional activator